MAVPAHAPNLRRATRLRAGFPVYGSCSADSETWVGYNGARRTIFRVADLIAAHYQEIAPYVAPLRQKARRRAHAEDRLPTNDRSTVNPHFGGAENLVVYDVSPREAELVSEATFTKADQIGESGHAGVTRTTQDKVIPKLSFVDGCAAVQAASIGASSVRRLMALGIQPIVVDNGLFLVAGPRLARKSPEPLDSPMSNTLRRDQIPARASEAAAGAEAEAAAKWLRPGVIVHVPFASMDGLIVEFVRELRERGFKTRGNARGLEITGGGANYIGVATRSGLGSTVRSRYVRSGIAG